MILKILKKKLTPPVTMTHIQLVIFYAVTCTVLLNRFVLEYIWKLEIPENFHNFAFKISTLFLIVVLQIILCLPFLMAGLTKPVVVAFSFIAFVTSYFSVGYGVIFDSTVTESVFVTNFSEISQYFNLHLFLNLSLILGLSMAALKYIKMLPANFRSRLFSTLKLLGACIALVAVLAAVFYKDYAGFFRNNRQVRHMITPLSPVYEISRYAFKHTFPKKYVFTNIGADAQLKKSERKKIVILVLGETARSDHFSLNGYSQNKTNPLLAMENVVSLLNFSSCGTATATSVPCIFSNLGRNGFDPEKASQRSNLLDIAKTAGYKVTWIDNNTGCQGVCRRTGEFDVSKLMSKDDCNGKTCYDEILLKALEQRDRTDKPELIVLHMLGSHGPSYHLRYPQEFKKFQPSCDTSELSACTKEQVINSYDNTILYTDYILEKIIAYLKPIKNADTAMFYVSDHGESLGENGIYLHSLPYFLAPKAQTHVPAILWFSDAFLTSQQKTILKRPNWASCEFSHDFIFSSLLGLLDIETKEYLKEFDIFDTTGKACPQ